MMRGIERAMTRLGAPAAALTLLAACAVASDKPLPDAEASAERETIEVEEVVVAEAAHDEAAEHESEANVVVTTKDGRLRVVVEDGEVKAWLDGEEIDAERLNFENGEILFLDEDGRTLTELNLSGDTRIFLAGEGDGKGRFRVDAAPRGKRVMLGVVTAQPGEALAAQLGLDRNGSVLITQVLPDHPAAKAGVEQFDVIVKADAHSKVNTNRLSRIIRSKEAGDEIVLGLIRKAKPRQIVVELEAVELRQGQFRLEQRGREREEDRRWDAERSDRHREQDAHDRARRHEHEARQQMRKLREQREMGEALRRRIEKQVRKHLHHEDALEKAMKHLEELDFDFDIDFNLGEELDREAVKEARKKARRALEKAMKELKGADVQKRMREAIDAVGNLDLEEQLGKIRVQFQPLEEQLEAIEGQFRFKIDEDVEWRLEELPEIEFLDKDGKKGVVIVAPEAPGKTKGEGAGGESSGLEALEERLERLEKMLQQLIERQEERGGGRRHDASQKSASQA